MKRYFQSCAKYLVEMNTLKSEKGGKEVCTANNIMERGVTVSSCGPGQFLVSLFLCTSISIFSAKLERNHMSM